MPRTGDYEERTLSLTILLSSLVFHFSSPKKNSLEIYYDNFSMPCMGPCLFLLENLFCLSHRKTHWTMFVDNVGLRICLLGTLNSMVTLTNFSLVSNEVVLGRVQQPIIDFTRPWNNFLVHGVKKPLIVFQQGCCLWTSRCESNLHE